MQTCWVIKKTTTKKTSLRRITASQAALTKYIIYVSSAVKSETWQEKLVHCGQTWPPIM